MATPVKVRSPNDGIPIDHGVLEGLHSLIVLSMLHREAGE